MIKSNELRIGSIVFNEKGEVSKVTALRYDHAHLLDRNGCKYSDMNGIPLTPDILEKAGFVNRSQSSDYCFEHHCLIIGGRSRKLYPCVWGESGLEPFGNEITTVHQLQNLFYAITGQELNIEL